MYVGKNIYNIYSSKKKCTKYYLAERSLRSCKCMWK